MHTNARTHTEAARTLRLVDKAPCTLTVNVIKTFSNGWVWLGIGSLLLFLVSFMVVLSWADYGFVVPASAASYAVAPLMSR